MSRSAARLLPMSLTLVALIGCGAAPEPAVPAPPPNITGSAPRPRVAPKKPFAPRQAAARPGR